MNAIAHAVVSARGLSKRYKNAAALDNVNFEIQPGRIVGLIGPNGAGKSTVINMLSGFYVPSQGRIRLGDEALAGRRAYAIARCGIARTYQTSQLFAGLSVLDNVALALPRGELGALLNTHQVSVVADKILATCVPDFVLSAHTVRVGVSGGIALFPQHGKDFEALSRHADAAMYAAKRGGRGHFRLYAIDGAEHQRVAPASL